MTDPHDADQPEGEWVVARLYLPCRIRGLDTLCAALEEVYGGPLFMRTEVHELIIFRRGGSV